MIYELMEVLDLIHWNFKKNNCDQNKCEPAQVVISQFPLETLIKIRTSKSSEFFVIYDLSLTLSRDLLRRHLFPTLPTLELFRYLNSCGRSCAIVLHMLRH